MAHAEEEPPAKADIVKKLKAATVLVEAAQMRGSGFCIQESGLIVIPLHLAEAFGAEKLTLVLNAGEPGQKLLKAVVIRRDTVLNFALVKAETEEKLPFLQLDAGDKLAVADEVISSGYASPIIPRPREYSAITLIAGKVESLSTPKDPPSDRIRFGGATDLGYSGGPVVNRFGKVVGTTTREFTDTKGKAALPVHYLRKFLDEPELALTAPRTDPKDRAKPVEFVAVVTALLPLDKPYEVELRLDAGNGEKRHPMKLEKGRYIVQAVAFPAGPLAGRPRVELRSPDGSIAGTAQNATFSLGERKIAIGSVRSVRFGVKPRVVLADGQVLEGPLVGLDSVSIVLGDQTVSLETKGATELVVTPPVEPRKSYLCTVVVMSGNREVGRRSELRYLVGAEPTVLNDLLIGKFVEPAKAIAATSYFRVGGATADPILRGKPVRLEGKEFKVDINDMAGVTAIANGQIQYKLEVGAPVGQTLKLGRHPHSKAFGRNEKAPGLNFSAGTGHQDIEGTFAVWELEIVRGEIVRCAIDFHLVNGRGPPAPVAGSLRYNSTLE